MRQDTRNYGKFHQRFAKGGAVEGEDPGDAKENLDGDRAYAEGGVVEKESKTEKALEKVAAGRKPWYATAGEGIKGFARGGAVKADEMGKDVEPEMGDSE